jgi:hypothetical protein
MSFQSRVNPLSRTADTSQLPESPNGYSVKKWWGVPVSQETEQLLRSRLIDSCMGTPVHSLPVNHSIDLVNMETRKFRDVVLGLALAISVSAGFWSGVGLVVSKLLR